MDSSVPKRNTDVYTRSGDKGIILGSSSPIVFELSQLACEIWELIDGKRNIKDITEEIRFRYLDVEEQTISADVLDYIDQLSQNELITIDKEKYNAY